MNAEDLKKYFEYLDALRDRGTVNMFGARPLLAAKFNLDKTTSTTVLSKWMDTFINDVSVVDRVTKAL